MSARPARLLCSRLVAQQLPSFSIPVRPNARHRAMASYATSDLPVICVIGTTGVGKSKLSIELAQHIARRYAETSGGRWKAAEVINADSMQIYKGLDVITNKVTEEEMEGINHRLLGIVDPRGEKGWGMAKWVDATLEEVADLHSKSEVPVITGGTTYWIQHLLFPLGKPPPSDVGSAFCPFPPTPSPNLPALLASLPTPLTSTQHDFLCSLPTLPLDIPPNMALPLHQLLEAVDPKLAAKWHWKDTRKVVSSLTRIWNKGERESEVWAKQEQDRKQASASTNEAEDGKRYRPLIFWLHAPPEVLNPRLDGRVDKMIDLGLLEELGDMRAIAEEMEAASRTPELPEGTPVDYASGIFQSIGYKEFAAVPTADLTSSALSTKVFQDALTRMKMSTVQYAKYQIRWITNKFRGVVAERTKKGREGMFLLDASDLNKWDENVLKPALSVLDAFLESQPLPSPESIGGPLASSLLGLHDAPVAIKSTLPESLGRVVCDICSPSPSEPHFVMFSEGDAESAMRAHTRGGHHKKHLRPLLRAERADEIEALRAAAKARKEEKERVEAAAANSLAAGE